MIAEGSKVAQQALKFIDDAQVGVLDCLVLLYDVSIVRPTL